MYSIDLNADLGEHPGTSTDEEIMPFISSCNIACGGHLGDRDSVLKTVQLAKKYNVAIGAHPSYPDPINFGRKVIDISPNELKESLSEQIMLVVEICKAENVPLKHIKPHGALYNQAAKDRQLSELMLEVLKEHTPSSHWIGLAGSECEKVATENSFSFIAEGFADRQYESDGSLRSRKESGAILVGQLAVQQAEELSLRKRVKTPAGWLHVAAKSICLHGDTSDAISLSKEIREHLDRKGVQVTSIQPY